MCWASCLKGTRSATFSSTPSAMATGPETKAELFRKVDGAVDVGAIEALVAERKLTSEGMDPNAVSAVREEMERAQARRLQPHFHRFVLP